MRHVARATFVVLLLLTGVLAVLPAGAQQDTVIDKDGWWNRANAGGNTPVGPLPVIPPAPPTNVPAGAIGVGAVGGDPDKVSAIGITLGAQQGAAVEDFTLTLKEAGGGAAVVNPDSAVIVACPITSFWAGGPNSAWDTQPEADCTAAEVTGSRAVDGTWTFDLTPIGALWLDPSATVAADGIVLVEKVDAPTSFQVSFQDFASGTMSVRLVATGGTAPADPFGPPESVPLDSGSSGGSSLPSDGGGGGIDPGGSVDLPPSAPVDPGPAAPSPEVPVESGGGAETPAQPISKAGKILGNLPAAVVVLLLFAVAVAGVMAMALGPAGEPATHARERGVSRALAAAERASSRRSSSTPALEAP